MVVGGKGAADVSTRDTRGGKNGEISHLCSTWNALHG